MATPTPPVPTPKPPRRRLFLIEIHDDDNPRDVPVTEEVAAGSARDALNRVAARLTADGLTGWRLEAEELADDSSLSRCSLE